jgi:aspartate kinase
MIGRRRSLASEGEPRGRSSTRGTSAPPSAALRILKFGGEALAYPESAVRYLQGRLRDGIPTVVVVSARPGVTDRLVTTRSAGDGGEEIRRFLRSSYAELAEPDFDRLAAPALTADPCRAGDAPSCLDHGYDNFVAVGERLSAHWFASRLASAGTPSRALEADEIGLRTDGMSHHGTIDLEASRPKVSEVIRRTLANGEVPVVTGYFGRAPDGCANDLGRGGSDYSAAALAAILRARSVDLVKGSTALCSADPDLIPTARPIPRCSFEDAERLAASGARILHPRTVVPLRSAGIPLRLVSLQDPRLVTRIDPTCRRTSRILTLTFPPGEGSQARPLARISIVGRGVLDEIDQLPSAVLHRAVAVWGDANEISVLVPKSEGERALVELHRRFVDSRPPSRPRSETRRITRNADSPSPAARKGSPRRGARSRKA